MKKNIILSLVLAISLFTGHIANASTVNDPWEIVNRPITKFNDKADKYLLKPIAQAYDSITPEFIQQGVGNFFSNLSYPIVVTNQFLQGKVKLGFQDTTRFLINSTFGIAGFLDVSKKFGLKENNEDFGQTLGFWGVNSGPYLVLPLMGPSNVRDLVGRVGDYYTNPSNYSEYLDDHDSTDTALTALNIIDKRAQLLKIERLISGDRYVFIRDSYLQRRADLIRNGAYNADEDPFLNGE
jgi:phospholipid-binding lipoprotein MlaA